MLLIGNKLGKLWFGGCPNHSFLVLLLVLISAAGCGKAEVEVDASYAASVTLSVKSSGGSVEADNVKVWAFDCDAQGNVSRTANVGYAFSADGSSVSLYFDSHSRYRLLLAGTDLPASFNEGSSYLNLRNSMVGGIQNGSGATGCALVDLASAVDGSVNVQMELFPMYGKLRVDVKTTSEAMTLSIDELAVMSSYAPKYAMLFSPMTPEEIRGGGIGASSWYFSGVSMESAAFSMDVTAGVDMYLIENPEGWTDLSAYRESGWTLNPAESDVTGYYLSVAYRYVMSPATSFESDEVVAVQKYVPLAPVCRGNEYRFDISINADGVVVHGSTEVSEEVQGSW